LHGDEGRMMLGKENRTEKEVGQGILKGEVSLYH